MSKVIWHTAMSLDGFIAGPDDSIDWALGHGGSSEMSNQTRDSIGAIIAGRRWYDLASVRDGGVGGIYGGAWSGPVFVLTHRPDDVPDDPTVTFLSSGIDEALAIARGAAGERNVELFGATIARQYLDAGLLDEIIVGLVPVMLGDGIRFYGAPAAGPVELERIELGGSRQVTDLRFRVSRSGDRSAR